VSVVFKYSILMGELKILKLTPGMQQYMKIKNENEDCIVLFRMGDFYETFFEDAKTIAKELEITLTSRGKGDTKAPLAGIPYHSIDPYIAKLIKKGYKVAIVEQVEDPKKAKGLVKRDLVRIITPGTVVESMILDEASNNYILGFVKEKEAYGVAFCDISTGEFFACELNETRFFNEVKKLKPAEIIFPMSLEDSDVVNKLRDNNLLLHPYDDRFFYKEKAFLTLKDHLGVMDLSGFGVRSELALDTAGALLSYIKESQKTTLPHINKLAEHRTDNVMYLDNSTIRNLELLNNIMTNKEDSTLLGVLDRTITPMGKRLLRKWIISPLIDKEEIKKRQDSVAELIKSVIVRESLRRSMEEVYDIERLIGRISYGNANPKDLVAMKLSLCKLPDIKIMLKDSKSELLKSIHDIPGLTEAKDIIEKSIKDEPNTIIREGNIIRKGFNQELDELRGVSHNTKKYLAELEEKEKASTGIKSLKIRYNKVFGYYIEVTKSNLHLVPENYIRKQTQVNSERFITEELKEKESKILGAEERIVELEYELFMQVLERLQKFIGKIQDTAQKLAVLDTVVSFAEVANDRSYVRPSFSEDNSMEIINGRHPVIEAFSNINFVPNDCRLDDENRTMIITGPNMAGKSTYMRQNALICLMAQLGCFVPAEKALLPVHDRIFTRVGAYDDLVSGQSTFMVEMTETANILNNATEKSFVILDEIGRGTSTYDGLSLAWAIAEYLHEKLKAKTLFATHYHHLNKLAEKYVGIKNYNITVNETEDKIIFLRKIVEGGTDKSYGIEVARLAGIPKLVIESSKSIMTQIEMEDEIGDMIHKKLGNPKELDEIRKKLPRKSEDKSQDLALTKFF